MAPLPVSLWALTMFRIGIDLGGTKTEVALLGPDDSVLFRDRVPTPTGQGPRAIVLAIAELVGRARQCLPNSKTPHAIGLGTPGSLSPQTGLLRNSNTQCLNGFDLQRQVSLALGQPVRVENDANCFALAEARAGAGRGFRMVFGVILGTGCGGGLVIDGTLHTGRNRLAGEWGHVSVDSAGPRCWCGGVGCLEMLASGSGVEARYQAFTGQARSAKLILADSMDPHALACRSSMLHALVTGLAQLVNTLDPDVVVLGGGLSNLGWLPKALSDGLGQRVFGGACDTPIRRHELGDSAGVLGAAWLSLA
jgi:fructokinase